MLRKTKIAVALLAAVTSGLSATATVAAEKSMVTIVPDFFTAFVRNFNPYLNTSLRTTNDFIYEPLVVFNEMKGNEPVFRLATGFTMAPDLKSITFDIRDGVKWSDGQPFTADDVVFSFDMVKKHPEMDSVGIYKWISKAEKVGQNKVKFDLVEVNTAVANEIVKVPVVAKHVWEKVKDPVTFTNENPVGTGPYTQIETFTPQLYVQCENPNYWQKDQVKVDCLRMPQIANNDQLLAKIVNSELDWTSSFIPDIDRTYAAASPNHKYWYTPAGTTAFVLNYTSPNAAVNEAINNVDFRRAFSMALDRQAIIDIAAYGNGVVNDYASGIGPAFKNWASEDTHNKYKPFMTHDVKGAKELLAKAGFKDTNGDGFVETPSGKKLELTVISPNGWTDFNNVVQLGVEQLADVGIKAKAATPEFAVLNTKMAKGDYDAAFTNYFHGPTPFKYFDTAFNSKYQGGEQFGRFAMHHYKDAELDKLLDSFNKTADKKEQHEIMNKIQERIASQQITIPVYSGVEFFQYNTKRFDGWFNEKNPVARPQIWNGYPERLLQVLSLTPKQS
ncbi:MAG: ABC transporter substrate-binding protein [Plesiomonas shigelloides]